MKIIDTREDFNTLQAAMAQLSMLAASAPNFHRAIAAAQAILGSIENASEDLEKLLERKRDEQAALDAAMAAKAKAEKDLMVLKDDWAELSARRDQLMKEYDSTKDRLDAEADQYRAQRVAHIRRELAAMEEKSMARKNELMDVVSQLEKRKTAAEEALRALKASI